MSNLLTDMFENLIVDQSCGVQGTNNYSRLVACGQVLENLFVSSPMAQSAAMQGKPYILHFELLESR